MTTWATASRWVLVGVFLGGMALGLALGSTPGRSQLLVLSITVYAAVGWLVTRRKPENPIGWLFLMVAAMTGLGAVADGMTRHALATGDPTSLMGRWGAWLGAWFWFPLFCCATLFTLMLFPDGLLTARWRPLLWTSLSSCLVLTVGASLATEVPIEAHPSTTTGRCLTGVPPDLHGLCTYSVDNPLGVPPNFGSAPWGTAVGAFLIAVLTTCFFLAVLSVVLRFRRSRGPLRLQMRWFALAAVLVAIWLLFSSLAVRDNSDPLWSDIGLAMAIALIPLSCGVAILRYHLYDIDRIISRTTSYAIVTGLVLAVYAAIVTSANRLLHSHSPVVIAAATLAAAALARPALGRVQGVVDHRFDRAHYDALRTVDDFGARLRHEVDPDAVVADLASVVRKALQPERTVITLVERS